MAALEAPCVESDIGTKRLLEVGRACPLCPSISDINLFRYCEGIIYLDADTVLSILVR